MSIIDEMLNEASTSMQASKIKNIEIDSIHRNKYNTMPIDNIEEMIDVLKTDGQLVPLTVYKESNNHYILISGERRWTAMKQAGYETAPCVIIDKPATEWDERLAIEGSNSQREETAEIQKQRVMNYSIIYDGFKSEGRITSGTLKRDWIGERMNLSGRQVQRYLKPEQDEELENLDALEDEVIKEDEYLRKLLKAVEAFKNKLQKFNNNEIINTEDYSLLNALSVASNEVCREAEILMNRVEEEKQLFIAKQ